MVFLVADLLYAIVPALIVASLTATWFLWFWFVFPMTHRSDRDEAGDRVRQLP